MLGSSDIASSRDDTGFETMRPRFQPVLENGVGIVYVGVMKHEPFDVARSASDADRDAEDRRIDALLATLPPCPGLPSTDEEIAVSLARADADIAAGRVQSHAVVGEWLKTWGRPGRKPFREWLAERDG